MNKLTEQPDYSRTRLVLSLFTYIASRLKERDPHPVHHLRLRRDQAERISRMSATDFLRLGELGGRCVQFDIDPAALDSVFEAIDAQRARDELIERCIRRDAPRAMMQSFFGMSRHRYSKLRTALGMPARAGRNPRAPETVERRIYELWVTSNRRWTARTLLDIASTLDVSLRTIWSHLNNHR